MPKWKINVGTEQSPIALFRSHPAEELDGELKIHEFNDAEYRHRYAVNMEQSASSWKEFWTGTSYQVKLDYRKDFLTTQCINLFDDLNKQARKERLKRLGISEDKELPQSEDPMTVRGIQFHFHSPSEHTIDGRQFDLELHIVHKLMYVQKNQEHLFDKWRYMVTTIFFDRPKK